MRRVVDMIRYHYFFFLGLLIIPINTFAQEAPDQVNYEKCEYVIFNSNVYAPFYVHINHDPAIAQTFKSRHDDNPTVIPFQRAPEGVEPGQATWFEFGSAQNATATYDFELDLEYAALLDHPRVVVMQLYTVGSVLMFEKKFYQDEMNGCVAVKIHAEPPPHVFTYDEILKIADEQNAATTKVYAQNIEANTLELRGIENWQVIMGIIVAGLILITIFKDRHRERKMKLQKEEYELRNQVLVFAIEKQESNNQWLELNLKAIKTSNEKLVQSMVGVFGDTLQKIETMVSGVESKFTRLFSDMRKELDLAEERYEKIQPVVTFVDSEGHAKISIEPEKPNPETVSHEPEKNQDGNVDGTFGFDIRHLVKEPMKLFEKLKKEKTGLPQSDDWEKLSNAELRKLEAEYVAKSHEDFDAGRGYTDNYAKAERLHNIIQSRQNEPERDESE